MALKKDSSSPKKGMNRDKAVFDLDKMEYSFAMNTNFQDEHGSGQLNLQNEPSNIYCSGFKDGYKVIGHKFDINADRTYFFLTNPSTGCSEIGFINSFFNVDGLEQIEKECGCDISVVLETPLENQTQSAICTYTTIISDFCSLLEEPACTGCLNFSIDFPIYESNIHIKDEKTGKVIYWTDFLNPQRYLQLDRLEIYTQDVDPCTGEIVPTCIQCDKLRIFKLFDKPCIRVRTIQNGGNLKAGMYEALGAYCTAKGEEISDYYALTNPTPIHDRNNNILDQTNLDYITNLAIGLDITDLDDKYEYYKVAVIYRSGLDASVTVKNYGVFPISNEKVSISSLVDKPTMDLLDVLARKPFYTKARGMASGNGYLFQYGMETHREINLQPVINLLGAFVRWSTVQANEDVYDNGAHVSNYLSYMRDEVVPLSIKFFFDGGYETSNFTFIARPPKPFEIEELGAGFSADKNTASIDDFGDNCTENLRNKRWQFENTATKLGDCVVPAGSGTSTVIVEREIESSCFVEVNGVLVVVADIAGPADVPLNGSQDLVSYINQNSATIIASTDPDWTEIAAILTDTYDESCEALFDDNCGNTPTLISEEIIAISTATEEIIVESKPFEDYEGHPSPPSPCSAIQDLDGTGLVRDTAFETTFMRPGEIVYERQLGGDNTICSLANPVIEVLNPQVDNSFFMQYEGELTTLAPLQTALTVSATGVGYTTSLHINALWYEIPFNGLDSIIVELSPNNAPITDDVCQNSMRLSAFDSCSATTDIPAYGTIIADITLVNDPQKFIVLDAADFGGSSSTAYIALDSPILTDVDFTITLTDPSMTILLTGTSGEATVTIGAFNYGAAFTAPDLTATAANFVSNHATQIAIDTPGLTVTSSGEYLIFSGLSTFPAISIANDGVGFEDLDGIVSGSTANITIESIDYLTTFDTDLTTTADNFITDHASNILTTHDIVVTAALGVLFFRSTEEQFNTVTVTNVTPELDGTITVVERYHVLSPPCGCINIFIRQVETETFLRFTGLEFGKKMTYSTICEFTIPVLGECDPIPHEFGKFSYWESAERYPCNDELYNSFNPKDLPFIIEDDDIPDDIKEEFAEYFTGNVIGGPLIQSATDFRDQPIRHYKFPCNTLIPFMSRNTEDPGAFGKSVVYPIGFSIDNSHIKAFLDIAVKNGLLTLPERARIKKYEIFRGDRSVDRSVIAKGMLFDMYEYPDTGGTAYYPNYPLNSLGRDQFNGGVPHPEGSVGNRQWTFHSPDTSFYKPTLPREMKVEGYQFGKSASYFDIVRDHPTYVVLGDKAFKLATDLAILEVSLKIAMQIAEAFLEASAAGTVYGVVLSIVFAVLILAIVIAGIFEVGEIRYQWLETFRNLGHPYQFAYYSATLGHYSYFVPNPLPNETLRGLPAISYLNDGRWSVPNEAAGSSFDINNLDREDSVFLTVGSGHSVLYPPKYINYDNVNANAGLASRKGYPGEGGSGKILGNAASPYVALKQYLPSQYGSVSSIKWLYTGFCGDLNSSLGCNPIFGGDIYISRFSVKRKLPFFTANSHGLAPLTPFKYSDYFNINPNVDTNRFYMNYLIDDDESFVKTFIFPTNRSTYILDADPGTNFFFIKPPAKFYLFSYGFPYFLVESVINVNYRYARREKHENFYPNVGSLIEFTQESNVSIREPNTYYYNFVYSTLPTTYPYRILPVDYNEELYSGLHNLTNTTIYSRQDSSENSLNDPWLLYRGLDFYDFPKSFGKLIDMDSIESEQILGRFENGLTIFGSIDQLGDRLTPETKNIGTGGIFAGRSVNFNKTELGHAGTQHKAKVSCEFGHFWTDAKRGKVFRLQPNGKDLDDITLGVSKWFKENLPFKITHYISDITQDVLDNNFKGLGIIMGWDSRLQRVFLTKLDYKPIGTIRLIGKDFFVENSEGGLTEVQLTDTDHFEDCSFTVAYSPLTQSWISYYSFKPNYFIAFDNYFQTGVNYSVDASEEGLWSHLPFLSSYQVFYGKLYPWIIEDSMPSKLTNSMLHSIEYWLDVRKYYNKYDFADIHGQGFNKAFIYNMQQNSGQLNLVHQKNNDLSQSLKYPIHNTDSIDILQSEISGKWAFNHFYNIIKNERNGLPIWLHDCNQINKVLNNKLLNYKSTFKDRLRGDYFTLRLQQDIESRFKMIYRFNTDVRDYYEQ